MSGQITSLGLGYFYVIPFNRSTDPRFLWKSVSAVYSGRFFSSRRLCQAVWRRMYATVTNLFDLGRDSYRRMPECLPNSENGDLDKIHIEPSLIFFFESIFGLDSLTWLGAITSS